MAKDFPKDEFDSVTGPGGRHRAKRSLGSRLVSFLRYAAVSVSLALIGITVLNITSGSSVVNLGTQTVVQDQFKAGGLGVTVIDGTDKKGLASKVAHQLFDAGWNILTATNYSLMPKFSKLATATSNGGVPPMDPATAGATPSPSPSGPVLGKQTVVFVNSTEAQAATGQLMQTLGNFKVVQANTYEDPITIVLGSDYK